MDACHTRFRRLARAARLMLAIGSTVVAADVLAAPVVVTPTNLQGWVLYDGGSGTSPATITGASPEAGNGSVELDINSGTQQPSVFHPLSGITFGQLVNSNMTFGFSWLLPGGAPSNSSPTIRLLLSGLGDVTQPGTPARTDGSLGWYMNTPGTGAWQTSTFSMTSGDFFFRVGGVGQESLGCNATSSSFDDRRQTLATWAATCNGSSGKADIDDALVVGIQVDWGTFPGSPVAQSAFTDLINYSIGSNSGAFNFEVSAPAAAVPEPESMALMLLGLGLVCGATVRRRRAGTSAAAH